MEAKKTPRSRPGYVPKEGWFFDLKPSPQESKVYLDGKVVRNVSRVVISANAGDGFTTAALTLIGNLQARVIPEHTTIEQQERKNAPWKV